LGGTQVVDVRDVVTAVPCVGKGGLLDGLGTVLGMVEAALPLIGGEGLEEHDPAGVEGFDELERPLDGGAGGVVEGGPGLLVIGLDGGPVFGEGEANAGDGVHVAVGDVMDELADGPAVVAVGCVELRVAEAVDSVAELAGEIGDGGDGADYIVAGDRLRRVELADGEARIGIGVGHRVGHRVVRN
jgi:hypothetical protein